jgi:hypothetical protein
VRSTWNAGHLSRCSTKRTEEGCHTPSTEEAKKHGGSRWEEFVSTSFFIVRCSVAHDKPAFSAQRGAVPILPAPYFGSQITAPAGYHPLPYFRHPHPGASLCKPSNATNANASDHPQPVLMYNFHSDEYHWVHHYLPTPGAVIPSASTVYPISATRDSEGS